MFNNEDRTYTNVERAGGVSIWRAEARESGTYVRLKQKNREGKVQLMGKFSNLCDC